MNVGCFNGACEGGSFQEICKNVIVFGCGDFNLAHKPNEYLEIDKYNQYNKLLINLLKLVKDTTK